MNEAERQSRRDSARAWLRRSWRTEEERAALEGLRADVYRRLTGGTRDAGSAEHLSGSRAPHRLDGLSALNETIDGQCEKLLLETTEALRVILQVRDANKRKLLLKHYACYESMEQIAREMSYTKRHIARLHREGLDEVAEILERKNS